MSTQKSEYLKLVSTLGTLSAPKQAQTVATKQMPLVSSPKLVELADLSSAVAEIKKTDPALATALPSPAQPMEVKNSALPNIVTTTEAAQTVSDSGYNFNIVLPSLGQPASTPGALTDEEKMKRTIKIGAGVLGAMIVLLVVIRLTR